VSNFDRADAVFVAVPSRIEDTIAISGPRRITLKVTEALKGNLGPVVSVKTPASQAACGIPFALAKSYLVFAEASARGWVVRACEGTKLMSQVTSEEMAALRKPTQRSNAARTLRDPER
jgi:hypothetical protein